MKKFFATLTTLIMTVAICFSFIACGDNSETGENIKTDPSRANKTRYTATPTKNPYGDPISFKDDNFYYYMFYLGDLQNVPLQENVNIFKYDGRNYEYSVTTQKSTSSSIEKQVTTATEYCTDWIRTWSGSLGANINLGAIEISVKNSFEIGVKTSNKKTASETFKEAETFTENYSETVKFSFNDSCEQGFYRYILMGEINVYGVVIYDFKNDTYKLTNYSLLAARYFTFDYCSSSAQFKNESYETLPFNLDEQYIKNLPVPEQSIESIGSNVPPTIETLKPEINSIVFNRQSCKLDNGFDPRDAGTDIDISAHSTFELYDLQLHNCVKLSDGKYCVPDGLEPQLILKLLQDPAHLPTGKQFGSTNWTKHWVSDDNYSKLIYGTNITNQMIRSGAYYLKISYTDGSIEEFNGVHILEGASKDNLISLNFDLKSGKILKSIDVVFVYELFYDYMSHAFDWNGTKCYANWRCSATLQFET